MTIGFVSRYEQAVKRTGIKGNKQAMANNLFESLLSNSSGIIISKHEYDEVWSLIKNKDKKVYLEIPEMFEAIQVLKHEPKDSADFPFIMMAGERRGYNANQIFRNPAWRKTDQKGSLRMHPEDAQELALTAGAEVICESESGNIQVFVELDNSVRRKVVTLPNGYGFRYKGNKPEGPELNMLTKGNHCEPFTKTPYHKYLPVKIRKVEAV
jgi:anaerobic selenocysteine-containing dehydrogenase